MELATQHDERGFQIAIKSVVAYLVGKAVEAQGPTVAERNTAAYLSELAKEVRNQFSNAA